MGISYQCYKITQQSQQGKEETTVSQSYRTMAYNIGNGCIIIVKQICFESTIYSKQIKHVKLNNI